MRSSGLGRGAGRGVDKGNVVSGSDAHGEDNLPTANRSYSSRDNDNGGRGAANGRGGSGSLRYHQTGHLDLYAHIHH
jgi:hypothetical protein